jgi:hypothetical protein
MRFGRLEGQFVVFPYEGGDIRFPVEVCRKKHGEWFLPF